MHAKHHTHTEGRQAAQHKWLQSVGRLYINKPEGQTPCYDQPCVCICMVCKVNQLAPSESLPELLCVPSGCLLLTLSRSFCGSCRIISRK